MKKRPKMWHVYMFNSATWLCWGLAQLLWIHSWFILPLDIIVSSIYLYLAYINKRREITK